MIANWRASAVRLLAPVDLVYERVAVRAKSSDGTPYVRWAPIGMPHLAKDDRSLLKAPFFLYHSLEDAKAGSNAGGTGFLVGVRSAAAPDQFAHVYGVSNWHVAVRDGASIIRINSVSGPPVIFEFDPAEWHFRPNFHDIAAIPLNLDPTKHDAVPLALDRFLTDV